MVMRIIHKKELGCKATSATVLKEEDRASNLNSKRDEKFWELLGGKTGVKCMLCLCMSWERDGKRRWVKGEGVRLMMFRLGMSRYGFTFPLCANMHTHIIILIAFFFSVLTYIWC